MAARMVWAEISLTVGYRAKGVVISPNNCIYVNQTLPKRGTITTARGIDL